MIVVENLKSTDKNARDSARDMLDALDEIAYPQPYRAPDPIYTVEEIQERSQQREQDVLAAINAIVDAKRQNP